MHTSMDASVRATGARPLQSEYVPTWVRSVPSALTSRAWAAATRAELHRLVDALPDDAVEGAGRVLELIRAGRIDPDQAWFWSPDWMAGEQEADEQLERGERGEVFETEDAFLAALRARRQP